MIILKSREEIAVMRRAGAMAAEVLKHLADFIKPGVSTEDLDRLANEFIVARGAKPTFVGYQGYPKSLCTSINEEVVHGIPHSGRVLKEGDIIGIDCGVSLDGFVGDHAMTFVVGETSPENRQLIAVTQEALQAGIEAIRIGNRVGDVSYAVQRLAEMNGFGVVKDFVGHGIGRRMHEEPQVPNYGQPGTGPRLKIGMVLAIEPMFNLGTGDVQVLSDKWTVVTKDGLCSSHFEHTVALTENGAEVLTVP